MPLIDAHLHQWDPTVVDYPWLGDAPEELNAPHLLGAVEAALVASGVTHAVLVQAADSVHDTAAMLAAARAHEWVAGVVAWAPLDDPVALAAALADFADEPLVVGVRALIHDRADGDWILSEAVAPGLAALAAAGLPFDFVTNSPDALAKVPALAARHPELTIVIDHLGKPPIGGDAEAFGRWRDLLVSAARSSRVLAKVSGLYAAEPAALSSWTRGDVRRVLDAALDCFGPDRLMLGSDWPLSELAGGHARVWGSLLAEVDMLAPVDREAIKWRTARDAYLSAPGAVAVKEEESP